jgi:ABC-type ATPase with predicted acetyltransferase domain
MRRMIAGPQAQTTEDAVRPLAGTVSVPSLGLAAVLRGNLENLDVLYRSSHLESLGIRKNQSSHEAIDAGNRL